MVGRQTKSRTANKDTFMLYNPNKIVYNPSHFSNYLKQQTPNPNCLVEIAITPSYFLNYSKQQKPNPNCLISIDQPILSHTLAEVDFSHTFPILILHIMMVVLERQMDIKVWLQKANILLMGEAEQGQLHLEKAMVGSLIVTCSILTLQIIKHSFYKMY